MEKLIDVYEKFQARQEDENLKPEFEYAIVDNTVKVGRYHPFSLKDEQQTLCSNGSMALQTSKPGRLAALHWAYEDTKTLKGDEVEIETYVTGLNFKVRPNNEWVEYQILTQIHRMSYVLWALLKRRMMNLAMKALA